MYLVDFKRKEGGLTYYPPLSAINALRSQGFFIVRNICRKENVSFEKSPLQPLCNPFYQRFSPLINLETLL